MGVDSHFDDDDDDADLFNDHIQKPPVCLSEILCSIFE